MTTPIDPQKAGETSSSNETAIDIAGIDGSILDNIWLKLCYYREHYSANISEIAFGLQISRPVVTEFLGNGRERGTNEPKFSRGRILNLFAELTRSEKLNPQPGKKLTEPQRRRIELKIQGPDELLIAAGLISETMKTVMVSPLLEPQLTFISFLYDNRRINPDLFSQIIKQELDIFEGKSQVNAKLIDKLKENMWIDETIKDDVRSQYKEAIQIMGRKVDNLTPMESAGLLKSILSNRLNKSERFDTDLIVTGVERTSLSIPWENVEGAVELLHIIKKIGKEREAIFTNIDCMVDFGDDLCVIYPVTRTVVKCIEYNGSKVINHDRNDVINFECVSTGTHLATPMSAILQNMGFRHSILNTEMSIVWLGKDIKSLVSTAVTITDNSDEVVSGEWVSSDLIQSLLQAMIITSNKWFHKKLSSILSIEKYLYIIKSAAELKSDFYKLRLAFDEYDLDSNTVEVNKFIIIESKARKYISELKSDEPDILNGAWDTFLHTYRRISILSKLYLLQHRNAQVNYKSSDLIEEIQQILIEESDINKEITNKNDKQRLSLVSARIGLSVQKIAHNLSFGISFNDKSMLKLDDNSIEKYLEEDLFKEDDNLVEYFDALDVMIEKEIRECEEDPGYDIYHSLGSYHSIVGRVLFYTGEKKGLEAAFNRFLKAAHYFQRIGLTQKVQRSLALAGRTKIRLGDREMADECRKLCENVISEIRVKLKTFDKDFSSSMYSRLDLLRCEYEFITSEDKGNSLISCLRSLKGALWLGLNRHILDILYTLSLCAKELPKREIKDDLKNIFPELWEKDGLPKLVKDRGNNQVAVKVAEKLISGRDFLGKSQEKKIYWSSATKELQDFLIETWNDWYQEASGNKEGKHPFVTQIEKQTFLRSYL
jgi:hypothetical protein